MAKDKGAGGGTAEAPATSDMKLWDKPLSYVPIGETTSIELTPRS